MTKSPPHEVTQLLRDWSNGNKAALDKLVPLVQAELHRRAHHYMRLERPGHSLQTTALVNEAYLHMVDQKGIRWQDRAHFFAASAQVMRHVLVDYARRNARAKRGSDAPHTSLEDVALVSPARRCSLGLSLSNVGEAGQSGPISTRKRCRQTLTFDINPM